MKRLAYLIVFGVLCIAPRSQGAFVQVRPVEDRDGTSQVSADVGPWTLRADGGGALIFGTGFSGGFWRTSMEFDIRGVSGTVSQATLTYLFDVVSNPPAAYRLHGFVGDGVVTPDDMAVNNPIIGIQTAPQNFPPATQVDVSAFVQSLLDQHASYAGFTFSGFPGGSGAAIKSSEPFVNSPLLTITTVPEPMQGCLIVGFMSLGLLKRRRIRLSSSNR